LVNNPSNPLTGVDYIEARFAAKADPTLPILLSESGIDFVEVLPDGIWTLTPNQPATGGSYDLKFYLNGFSHLKDNNFIVVRRPDNSASDADWEIPSGSSINATGGAGRMVADGYALRKGISGFSQFGIAVSSAALPVQLTHFDGLYQYGLVQLQWSTASEAGAAYFKVERGLDGKLFSDIATLPAKGNSNVSSNYMYADSSAVALGKSLVYYRLRQTDKDGRFLLSKTVAVKIADEPQISVWGNPVDKHVQLTISLERADKLEWQLTDAAGKLLQSGLRQMNAGLSSLQIDMTRQPAGMYYLQLSSSTISRSITLMKR
ncbi:MAG TPA: T9SS type A sorting domain-containing protein, partial [Chitinophagaceae bacterium]|nr:T9SS type A sorting domain-containing protein [Chitinophagaceae bacterium]